MSDKTTYRKKMIEVALPLEAINAASSREKSIRRGHPSTLHLWWARRPLAACRAVLFSSLVNDPDDDPMYGINEDTAATERAKLFDLIEELVIWENSNNPDVINRARLEIARSIAANKVADEELEDDAQLVAGAPGLPEEQAKYLPDPPPEYTPHDVRFKMPGLKPEQVNHFLAHYAPPVLDPFAGGGSIPLEAQRLGLRAYASDLNPVAVLINKALIEIPPKFAGQPPVNPDWQNKSDEEKSMTTWQGAQGLAEDVRYYGKWMRDEAEKRIGHLYPKVRVTQEMVDDGRPDLEPYVGQELTMVATIWFRTVNCPNPACDLPLLLASSFCLAKKKSRPVFISPRIVEGQYQFDMVADPNSGITDLSKGTKVGAAKFTCLGCGTTTPRRYIEEQSQVSLREIPAAVVLKGSNRVYISPRYVEINLGTELHGVLDILDVELSENPRDMRCRAYGFDTPLKLFNRRQLATLVTFSDVTAELRTEIAKFENPGYSAAIVTYLACVLSRTVDYNSSFVSWHNGPKMEALRNMFSRQSLSMVWDYAEGNPFSDSSGNWKKNVDWVTEVIAVSSTDCISGVVAQADARTSNKWSTKFLFSSDPPYYDNIAYSDLSDVFYVWLRRSLKEVYRDLLNTRVTPKADELVALPYRNGGGKQSGKEFFEQGIREAVANMHGSTVSDLPITIYYAFRQSEETVEGQFSTGWETFLTAVLEASFTITGTWPIRTEMTNRVIGRNSNMLASSIVLACRPRGKNASMVTRRDFANALRKELPEAIRHLQSGGIAPVDLQQAAIGPGMAIFSRYSKVMEADGSAMPVRMALALINQELDNVLEEQEGEYEPDTRFAIVWFEQHGFEKGVFGTAETLATAKAVSVDGVVDAGILHSAGGKVRLLKPDELEEGWSPDTDDRLTVWEVTHYLCRALEKGGNDAAAELVHRVGPLAESARDLAYRLYAICDKNKWASEAQPYNALVASWHDIQNSAARIATDGPRTEEGVLFET